MKHSQISMLKTLSKEFPAQATKANKKPGLGSGTNPQRNAIQYTQQKGCLKKVEYSSKEFKFKGSLIIPAAVEWGKVLWNVFKENTAEELKDENALRKALEAAWPSSFGTRNLHSKAKRVFSLPVVATQSGAVRIRRKTAFNCFELWR